jgi:hypothetical protein
LQSNLTIHFYQSILTMKKLYVLIMFIGMAASGYAQCSVTATSLSDVICNSQCNGVAYAAASGGTPPYTYSWAPSGGGMATGTGLCAGVYTAIIMDSLGCVSMDTVNIVEPPPLDANALPFSPATCWHGEDGCAVSYPIGGNGGPFQYVWSSTPPQYTSTACDLDGGDGYTVTVTDIKGCTAIDTMRVENPSDPVRAFITTQVNVSCNGACDAYLILTVSDGTAPYTYNFTPLLGNTYTVTGLCTGGWASGTQITDANGCSPHATATTFISEPAVLNASTSLATNVACAGGNGCATVAATGGTGPYSYLWSPTGGTGDTACGLVVGDYTVTVTDANGCTTASTISITQPASMTANATALTSSLCSYSAEGSATVLPTGGTGPYTYSWSPMGGSSDTAYNLTPGPYNVLVTDANGCTATAGAVITSPPAIVPNLQLTANVSCNGGTDGCLTVNPTGGTGAYTYDWSTTYPNCALPAGTFTVTVTDENGCMAMESGTVNEPAALNAGLSVTNATCSTCNDGWAVATVSGGTPLYTYYWNSTPVQTTPTATGLLPGDYVACITDAYGCQVCDTITVSWNVSVKEIVAVNDLFTVYPNPFHSTATLILNADKLQRAEMVIYDVAGNEVRRPEIISRMTEISNLSPGIYLLVIRDTESGRISHSKMIVQ